MFDLKKEHVVDIHMVKIVCYQRVGVEDRDRVRERGEREITMRHRDEKESCERNWPSLPSLTVIRDIPIVR